MPLFWRIFSFFLGGLLSSSGFYKSGATFPTKIRGDLRYLPCRHAHLHAHVHARLLDVALLVPSPGLLILVKPRGLEV